MGLALVRLLRLVHTFVQGISMECFLLGKGKQFSLKGQLRLIKLPPAPFRFSRTFGEFLNLHLKASVLGLQLLGGIKSFKRSQKECSQIGSTSAVYAKIPGK